MPELECVSTEDPARLFKTTARASSTALTLPNHFREREGGGTLINVAVDASHAPLATVLSS
ncbi:hypothetical protein CMZ84_00655 [Lysobacteraceae bacterium NML93-0399]|nr:hypothetical protein CMZ84_00655 [Xanthomonadaceae bacterium NML93-0399]